MDAVDDVLVDVLPGVGEQLIVDPPIGQVERGDLLQIDQLAGFDEGPRGVRGQRIA